MKGTFTVRTAYTLARHLAVPAGPVEPRPGVILCHGFPIGPLDARRSRPARSRSSSTASPTTSATRR